MLYAFTGFVVVVDILLYDFTTLRIVVVVDILLYAFSAFFAVVFMLLYAFNTFRIVVVAACAYGRFICINYCYLYGIILFCMPVFVGFLLLLILSILLRLLVVVVVVLPLFSSFFGNLALLCLYA